MGDRTLIDKNAVAERLATTVRHVEELVKYRRIPFVKVGRLLRFDPDAIEEWIVENTRQGVS